MGWARCRSIIWWVIDAHVGGALDTALAEFGPRWLADVWGFATVHIDP